MAQLTPKTTAERLGISTRWLRELSKRGVISKEIWGKKAVHPWPTVRDEYNEHLRQQGALEAALGDLQAERAQLVRVQRETAELDLAVKRKTLITVHDATAESDRLSQHIRARLLNMPGRLGPHLVAVPGLAEVVGRLDDGVREALTELVESADEYQHQKPDRPRVRKKKTRKSPKRARRASPQKR